MLSCLLKRVLPFALTLTFGVALGSLLRPTSSAPAPYAYTSRAVLVSSDEYDHHNHRGSCASRARNFSRSSDVVVTYRPRALYTDEARREGITGSVGLRVEFKKDGTVGAVTPVSTLPAGLTEAAVEAARGFQFYPKMVKGEAVDTIEWVEYSFDGSERGLSDF